MFQISDVVNAVKALASSDHSPDRSHCQALDFEARRLGFESYHHFSKTLQQLPSDQLGKVSLRLMRKICERRVAALDSAYFEFMAFPDESVGFYSSWIGWDRRGEEVRVPRPLDGSSAEALRKIAQFPIYVIESDVELMAWRHKWRSTAYIPGDLAKRFFPLVFEKDFMVEQDPPLDRIRARVRRNYANNIAFA